MSMDSSSEEFIYEKREVTYSFRNQFVALWNKSLTNQIRQYKTNLCQILFPLSLIFALFVLQLIVTSIIKSSVGDVLEEELRPSLEPSYFHIPTTSSSCKVEDIKLNLDAGRIFYASSSSSESAVGSYGGVPKDPIAISILGPDFVEPNPTDGSTPSGLLSYADSHITSFIGLKEKIIFENMYREPNPCKLAPQYVYPILYKNDSLESLDEAIYNLRYESIAGAYYFENIDIDNQNFSYEIKFNKTGSSGFDIPLMMNFISNAIWKRLVSDDPASILSFAGNKDFPKPERKLNFDLISLTGPFIYHFIYQLMWPVMLQSIVHDKEYRLRDIMSMMGMKPVVYWLVTYLFNFCFYMVTTLISIAFACILGFKFFLWNNFFAYFFLFFLWGHTMVAAALLFSVFFTKERTALVIGYFIILANGILAQSWVISYLDEPEPSKGALFGVSIFPPWALYRGIMRLSTAVSYEGQGLSFSEITDPYYALHEVYLFFIVQWFIFFVLAIYFENVLPIGPGIKKHPLFFLPKRFRCCSREVDEFEDEDYELNEYVREEKNRVLEDSNDNYAIKIIGLKKKFGSKVAVNNLTMGVYENECFGFLGPNGAGKTSTINILCGYHRPDSGTAIISGLDLRDNIDDIHLQMGVCPQEDLLWADLTGPEHLRFYGRLKNLTGKELEDQVEFWLKQVNLHDKKTKRKTSSEYSGGMRRRLSVAIALIGNSRVVLLDEPTTGLDPASKHALWDVIKKIKKHCSVILTTHSMEEAEELCDRLSIFASGRLLNIGTSAELKDRYGQYYKIMISTKIGEEDKVTKFLKKLCGKDNVRLVNQLAGTSNFEVPKSCIPLSKLTRSLQECDEFDIKHFGISSTTLEEVFIKLTSNLAEDEADAIIKKKKKKKADDRNIELANIV